MRVASYLKAIVGAGIAGLTALESALDDNGISLQEGVKAGIATLVALGLIWAVPNVPEKK